MTIWNRDDKILNDTWKPELNHRSRSTYNKKIVSFIETCNVKKITGFADLKTAVLTYLENVEPNMYAENFNLQEHIEKIQVVVGYFGWVTGVENAYTKLKEELYLPSKYTAEALKKLKVSLPNYKRSNPNYVKKQKILQQKPRTKKIKLDWARKHQSWDSKLSEIIDKIKTNSFGCKFKNCNCQREKIPGEQNFPKIITGHHKKPKETNPELTWDEKNILDCCLGHHVWIHVICALYDVFPDQIQITKNGVVRQLINLTRIFSDAEAHVVKKILDDLENSLRQAVEHPTLENFKKSHTFVYALNAEIIARLGKQDAGSGI